MNTRSSILSLSLLCAVACTPARPFSPEARGQSEEPVFLERSALAAQLVDAAPGKSAAAAPKEASATRLEAAVAADVVPSAKGSIVEEEEFGLLKSAKFRRQFLESYLSETEIEPTVTDDERDSMVSVLELIAADKVNEAMQRLQELRGNASSAVFDFTLGNLFYQQDQLVKAEGAYLDAVRKFPKFRRAWGNLAQIHFRKSEFKAATGAFTKVVQLGGADAIVYGLLGVSHSRRGEDIAAESAFRMAMMLDPDTIDWKLGLAESFFKQRRFPDAVSLFQKLIDVDPSRSEFWLAQGEAYARMGQTVKAAENFEVVDQLGASTSASLFNLADIYANEALHDLAVDAYLRALSKDGNASVDRAIRAAKFLSASNALVEMRFLLEGIQRVRGETLTTDEKKELLKLRARLAVAEGSGDEEASILEEIVKLDPRDGDALILLGQHAARGGKVERAIFYYERAANVEKFEADAKVRHAQLLVRERRYEEAIPLLRRAQTIKPRETIGRYLEQVERVAKSQRGRSGS